MVRFADELRLLHDDAEHLRAALYERFTSELPQAAGMFPPGSRAVPRELIGALTYIFRSSTASASLTAPAAARLRAWALDLRRYGFPPSSYPRFARAVRDVLGAGIEARFLLDDAAAEMERAAAGADREGIPAATAAKIGQVYRDGRVTRVRLAAGNRVDYLPGQFLPVMQAGRPGVWRNLAPALPANPFGQLEFHVAGEIDPVPGGYVTLGAARGASPRFDTGEMTVLALGTGAAAAKAIVFHALDLDRPPRIRLALVGEVADRGAFTALAREHGWLSVDTQLPDHPAGQLVVCGPHEQVRELGDLAGAVVISPDAPADWSVEPG